MLLLLGGAMWYMNREYNPTGGAAMLRVLGSIGVTLIAVGGVMVWSSRSGKLAVRDKILDSLTWRGDEKVLDVGCGRGLMLIGAAKRLTTGRATGIDIWSSEDLSGNTAEATAANAKAEGIADKVKIENCDARRLSYQPNSFDLVLSSLAIHNIDGKDERAKALDEIWRVCKPGGRIVILDLFKGSEYVAHFQKAGATVERQDKGWLWCVPNLWFVARKP